MSNSLSKLVAICSLVGIAIFGWSATGIVNAQTPAGARDPELRRLQQERLDLAKLLVTQQV